MTKFLKFLLIATPVIAIGIYSSIHDRYSVIDERFDGIVYHIDWKSKNHGMPLIEIKSRIGKVKKFHHFFISLTSDDIKVGDKFRKVSGSTNCFINDIEMECLEVDI